MCKGCRAADERQRASVALFQAVQSSRGPEAFGIEPSLKRVFKPVELDPEWDEIVSRLDKRDSRPIRRFS